jgi:hypothetical protein
MASNYSKVFTNIYKNKIWSDDINNLSGPGSSIYLNNETYIPFLKKFIIDNNIKSIVDLGCGDFVCGKLIYDDIQDIKYYGYDIYEDIIKKHRETYKNSKYEFNYLDIINEKDKIINSDLCIIKDVLQHWPLNDIYIFLDYLCNNYKFKYILITNCCNQQQNNTNIKIGDFRPLSCDFFPLKRYRPIKLYNYSTKEVSVINLTKL